MSTSEHNIWDIFKDISISPFTRIPYLQSARCNDCKLSEKKPNRAEFLVCFVFLGDDEEHPQILRICNKHIKYWDNLKSIHIAGKRERDKKRVMKIEDNTSKMWACIILFGAFILFAFSLIGR